jgi:hypothetical protein
MIGNSMSINSGIIGVSDHDGWAVLVTVARDASAERRFQSLLH